MVKEPRVLSETVPEPRVRPNKAPDWKRGELHIPQTRYNLRSNSTASYHSRAVQLLLAHHISSKHFAHHIYDNTGKRLKVDDLLQGEH